MAIKILKILWAWFILNKNHKYDMIYFLSVVSGIFGRKPYLNWGQVDKNHQTYSDEQLEQLLEHVLKHTDLNKDGYVDYLEYRVSNYKAKLGEKQKEELGGR